MPRKSPRQARTLESLLPSWELTLAERQVSEHTIAVHLRTMRQLAEWLTREGRGEDVNAITAADLRAWLLAETKRTSAVSAHQHWRNLRVLIKWLIREGERTAPDPMPDVSEPPVTRKVKPILAPEQVAAVLRTCQGTPVHGRKLTPFEQKRDAAILDILIDTGVRVSGVAGMLLADVHLEVRHNRHVKIVLKGGDEHLIPLGRMAAASMDRYIRIRARHSHAGSPWLWLGMAGRSADHFTSSGIRAMVVRRAEWAGLGHVTPHWYRRGFAHSWLDGGGSESDGMRIAGWRSRAMMDLYAEDLAAERSRRAHVTYSPRDRMAAR